MLTLVIAGFMNFMKIWTIKNYRLTLILCSIKNLIFVFIFILRLPPAIVTRSKLYVNSIALDVIRRFDSAKNIFLNAFILARLIKIQPYYFALLVKFKQHLVHSAVGYCAAYITIWNCDFSVAVIKALEKIFCPAGIKYFILANLEIYTGGCRRVYMKSTERALPEPLQFVTLFLLLRIYFYNAVSIAIRYEVLHEDKEIAKNRNHFMRF